MDRVAILTLRQQVAPSRRARNLSVCSGFGRRHSPALPVQASDIDSDDLQEHYSHAVGSCIWPARMPKTSASTVNRAYRQET